MFAKSIARGSNYHIGSLLINARSFHSFFFCGGGEGGEGGEAGRGDRGRKKWVF